MEREKIIEEMAKVTCGYKVHCKNCKKVHPSECADRSFATMYINAGYRKIPDGAVVLTREEYYELKNKVKWAKELGASADKIRKEAILQFRNDLKDILDEQIDRYDKMKKQERINLEYAYYEDTKNACKIAEYKHIGQETMAEKVILYMGNLLKDKYGVEVEE